MTRAKEYWAKKSPMWKLAGGGVVFYWQSAYAGAYDHAHVIPGDVWDRFRRHTRRDKSSLQKEYDSAEEAVLDLLEVTSEG